MPDSDPRINVRTPVAVFCFNRPSQTAAVLNALRHARPRHLLLVADGPRADVPGEADLCAATRAVFDDLDWECDITTNFAPANLGLKARFDSGLSWVFDQVERAIILEDDCLPGADFFPFCDQLLERYAQVENVLSVAGCQHYPGAYGGTASYYYSRYPMIWGWATWRRAWRQHDPEMRDWPQARDTGWLEQAFGEPDAARYWAFILERVYRERDTWDYGWAFTGWRRGALHIHPARNLVRNIGFGAEATHTRSGSHPLANLHLQPQSWPLRHPEAIERAAAVDEVYERNEFSGRLTRVMADARQRVRHGADPQRG